MTAVPTPLLSQEALLKKISDKLTWGLIFLFIIMLNTCSVSDDVEDAIRDARRADARDAAAAPAPVAPAAVAKEAP